MNLTELQRLIADQLDKRSMSARQASLLSIGRPDFVRDIKNGSMPAFDKVCRLLEVLGLYVEIVPIDSTTEMKLNHESPSQYYAHMDEVFDFSKQIKKVLSDQRLSAREAALRAGLPVRAVQSILDGQNPRLTRIVEICHALGLEIRIGTALDESIEPTILMRQSADAFNLGTLESRLTDRRVAGMLAWLADEYDQATAHSRDSLATRFKIAFPEYVEARAVVRVDNWWGIGGGTENTVSLGLPSDDKRLSATRHIEIREVAAAAGSGAEVLDETVTGYLAFQRKWLDRHKLDATRCTVIGVAGESMEPTLPTGCSILVNHAQKRRRKGRIFVVRTDDGLVVKRAGRNKSGGKWLLESDHPAWESTPWTDDTEVIGEVRWMARTLK